jgi:Domain of unknown function (DUF4272)
MYRLLTLAFALVLASSSLNAMETSQSRKAKTERYLRARKVPINEFLPLIEDSKKARIRTARDVAERVVALYSVSARGNGVDQKKVDDVIQRSGARGFLTPSEREFLATKNPSQQQLANASWRLEAIWVLLWALGEVDTLDFPTGTCDMEKLHASIPKPAATAAFLASAKLRSAEEILDESDKIYRTHWAVRDAQVNGARPPAGLNPIVVVERHYALNWLTGYAPAWDDITTDT